MKAGLDKVKPLPKDKKDESRRNEIMGGDYIGEYAAPPAKKESKPSKKQPPKKKQAPERIPGPDETDVFISGDVTIDYGPIKKYNPRGAPRKVKD